MIIRSRVIPPEVSAATHPRRAATPRRRAGRSQPAAQAHARQEARRSSPERTAPAIAGSRNVRTGKARRPGLLCTRRGPRVRTDHTSHSSPAPFRSAAGPQVSLISTEHPPPLRDTVPAPPCGPLAQPYADWRRTWTIMQGSPFRVRSLCLRPVRAGVGGAVTNVVITGGAGFLGSRLARELLTAGSVEAAGGGARPLSRLTVLDQSPAPDDLAADERVAAIRGDLADLLDPAGRGRQTLAGADVIFHLAAAVSGECEADFDLGVRANLRATEALLASCRALA